MQSRLLPRAYKIVGMIIASLAFITPIIAGMLHAVTWEQSEPRRKIANSIVLIGLMLIVLAKEKVEDEFMNYCRLNAFRAALLAGVIYFILDYAGIFKGSIVSTSFGLILSEILVYLMVFHIQKLGIK